MATTLIGWRPSTLAARVSPLPLLGAQQAVQLPAGAGLAVSTHAFIDNSMDTTVAPISAINGMSTTGLAATGVGAYRLEQAKANKAKGNDARGNPPRGRRRV